MIREVLFVFLLLFLKKKKREKGNLVEFELDFLNNAQTQTIKNKNNKKNKIKKINNKFLNSNSQRFKRIRIPVAGLRGLPLPRFTEGSKSWSKCVEVVAVWTGGGGGDVGVAFLIADSDNLIVVFDFCMF